MRIRCSAQALVPQSNDWKTCIRETGHNKFEPHVWLEAFNVVGRRPIILTWYSPRETEPIMSSIILLSDGTHPIQFLSED